jgi:hypothetical protein
MVKKWLVPVSLSIFFCVSIPILFLENDRILAAGLPNSDSTKTVNRSSTASPKKILSILNDPHNHLTKTQIDNLLLQLFQSQTVAQKHDESILFSNPMNTTVNQYRLEDLSGLHIKDMKVKSFVQQLLDDGFKLSSSEGMIYIESDYPKLLKEYGKRSSNQIAMYLKIMATETQSHYAEDAALRITPDRLAERILQIESFLNHYPGFMRKNELRALHQRYLSAYLLGLNNTPAFQYGTDRIKEEFLKSYRKTMARYPKTQLAKILETYGQVLERAHYIKRPQVLKFIKDTTQTNY